MSDRRRYWTEQMEAAHDFFERVMAVPVAESGEPLVAVAARAAEAGIPLELSRRPHAGGRPRVFEVRASLVAPLLGAAEAMARRGWTLVLEDGFRSLEMQRDLATGPDVLRRLVQKVRWEAGGEPDAALFTRRLDVLIAANPKTAGHMAGAAVDVSVRDASGRELDRGAPYLELSELTPMDSPFVSARQRAVREAVTEAMTAQGLLAYPYEFWHYSAGDGLARVIAGSSDPAIYGPVGTPDLFAPLNDPDAVARAAGLVAARRTRGV